MSVAKAIIDAIAAKLETLPLPEHSLYLYRRPKALVPEDLPALVVWLRAKSPTPRTTVWFEGVYTVGISWHEEALDEATSLEADPELAVGLITRMEAIEAAIRELSVAGWDVPGAWELVPGDTTYLEPLRESAFSEGYTLDVLVRVTERG